MEVYGSWWFWHFWRYAIMIAIPLILLTTLVAILGLLFSAQEKRQRATQAQVEAMLERIATAEANAKVLAQNDLILLKDMKMMLHEFKSIEKKVKHPRG
jgi:uncharacterized membrane protein